MLLVSNGMEKKRVILYGKSVILGTVGASLRNFPDLEIVTLAPSPVEAQGLEDLSPDVIIFDLEAAHPDAALSLLKSRPRLLLIGINPETDQMLLWSGQVSCVFSMQDLLRAISATGSKTSTECGGAQPDV